MTRKSRSDAPPDADRGPTTEAPGRPASRNSGPAPGDGEGDFGGLSEADARVRRRIEEGLEGIVAAVVQRAQSGDMKAAKIALDCLAASQANRAVAFRLRPIQSSKDASAAAADVFAAVAEGAITIGEAERLMKLLGEFLKTRPLEEYEARLAALEDVARSAP